VDSNGELGGQAGLADPRLTGHQRDAPLPRDRLLPQLPEPGELAISADEDSSDVGEQRRHRDQRTGSRLPGDAPGRHRFWQTLQLQSSAVRQAVVGETGQETDDVRDQDLAAGGDSAQP
jgi:hypothetical protein